MQSEAEITPLLSESLTPQGGIVWRIDDTNHCHGHTNVGLVQKVEKGDQMAMPFDQFSARTGNVGAQLANLHLQTAKNIRMLSHFADNVEQIAGLHVRITTLEKIVCK